MRFIEMGHLPVDINAYSVQDVAERYDVHRDTVYKGIQSESPLFPKPSRINAGPKAWVHFTPEAIIECDQNRIAFYKTTPSWHELYGEGASAAPIRLAAKKVVRMIHNAG